MDINMKPLARRERQVAEQIAWGASLKEAAASLGIKYRTVDNILRRVKEKLHVSKNTEVSAWWFCTEYNISFDLSPMARKNIAKIIVVIFLCGELLPCNLNGYTVHRPGRRIQREARRLKEIYRLPLTIT